VNVEVVMRLSATMDPVRIDSTQFESAILNLVVNAREAVSGQGRIDIETKRVELGPQAVADNPGLMSGSYVAVSVSDDGCGIASDLLSRVFDPFVTTKEVGKGSGLGLSQVYGFAKESGGYVKIHSEIGVGTIVTLYLPRSMDEVLAAEPKDRPVTPLRTLACETILVVEDEKIVLHAVVENLKQLGYRVLTAENAAVALDILRSDEAIDVMFSDVVMPGEINGAQLAAAATRLRPKVKVLLTSGYAASALVAEHGLKDNIPLLQKPYRAHELVAQLHQLTRAA
jgi:CheY-like chemotaxis protein